MTKTKSTSDKKCYYCGKTNYLVNHCFQKKKDGSSGKAKPVAFNSLAKLEHKFSEGLIAVVELSSVLIADFESSNIWVIDSGCAHHMTSNHNWFANLKNIGKDTVLMRSNQKFEIEGVGSVRIRHFNREVIILSNVRLVPKLRRNFISVSMVVELGLDFTFKNLTVEIRNRKREMIIKANRVGNLYLIEVQTLEALTAFDQTNLSDKTNSWNRRLGHKEVNSLRDLKKQGLVDSEITYNMPFYEN